MDRGGTSSFATLIRQRLKLQTENFWETLPEQHSHPAHSVLNAAVEKGRRVCFADLWTWSIWSAVISRTPRTGVLPNFTKLDAVGRIQCSLSTCSDGRCAIAALWVP